MKVLLRNVQLKICTLRNRFQINNLALYLKELEKDEQVKPKACTHKEIMIRKISEIENIKTTELMKPKIDSLESTKLLARLIKKRRKWKLLKSNSK